MFAALAVLPMLLVMVAAQAPLDVRCSSEFCTNYLVLTKCGSLPHGCEKAADGTVISGSYFKSPQACNCCEYCVAHLKEGAGCVVATNSTPPISMCGPGLTCSDSKLKCVPLNTTCVWRQKQFDMDKESGTLGQARWRPMCDEKGDFRSVQCIPNSICYCIEPENGTRIFGETIYNASTPDTMSCGCSLAAWRASRLAAEVETAHCLTDGRFDPLQCVDSKCTCVNPTDGSLTSTDPIHIMNIKEGALPCFNSAEHTAGKFERSCEAMRNALLRENTTAEIEGFKILNMHLPECTPDGRYARTQIQGQKKVCVDPDGEKIEAFESNGTEISEGNCNCARTWWLLRQASVVELPVCCNDGSYRAWQCWRGQCYCVDCNGNQSSQDVDQGSLIDLPCYYNKCCISDSWLYSTE